MKAKGYEGYAAAAALVLGLLIMLIYLYGAKQSITEFIGMNSSSANVPTTAPVVYGAYFDGNEYIALNGSVSGNFTVSVWANYSAMSGTGVLVSGGMAEGSHSVWYVGTGGEVQGVTSCGVFSDFATAPNYTAGWRFASVPFIGTGEWHQITCTYNTSDISIYVDGVLRGTTPTPYPVYGARITDVGKRTSDFYINGTPTQAYYNGFMANVQIYNKSLGQSEVKSLYEGGISARPMNGKVLWLRMQNETDKLCLVSGSFMNACGG